MTEYFLYGTLLPGSRHANVLAKTGAQLVGPATLGPGYRLSVRYRGHGDDRFDRSCPSHYVEPILIPDKKSTERVCGFVYTAGAEPGLSGVLAQIVGPPRSYPLLPVPLEGSRTVFTNVRGSDTHDLIHRTDPCLHQYADGRSLFYDRASYLLETPDYRLTSKANRTKVAEIGSATLYEIAVTDLFWYDIHADTDMRRISVEVPLGPNLVPASQYVPR